MVTNGVRPILFGISVFGGSVLRFTVHDGSDGRGDDDSFNFVFEASFHHSKGSVDSWVDKFQL